LTTPPKHSLKFLRWFCREDCIEEIEGNLVEVFERECERSPKHARRNFTLSVIKHFRPAFMRRFKTRIGNNVIDMLKHNVLITFRNFMKYKSTFMINVSGLTIGLATVFFVYLWVRDERSMNRFNANDDRLYRIFQTTKETDGTISTGGGTPGILADALAAEMPEVETAVSVVPPSWFNSPTVVIYNDKKFKVPQQYAGKNFFKVFTANVIRGDVNTALSKKYNVLLSEDFANRLFGNVDESLGKMIDLRWGMEDHLYEVTGVFRLPSNVTEHYDLLLNYEDFLDRKPWLKEWGNSDPETYIVLKNGTNPEAVSAKLSGFLMTKQHKEEKGLMMQRYSDTYLYNRYEGGRPVGGRIEYVRLFTVIAIVILVIACINFMNLSTARATRRLKEVGVKKAVGARRGALAGQFLVESISLATMSALLAVFIVWLLMPSFNSLTGKHLVLMFEPEFISYALLIVAITGFISGSYPALYLSKFRAGEVLKGKIRNSLGELIARKGLVMFQYAMSFMLIVGVIIIYKQIEFVQSMNLGYNREHVIHFDMEIEPSSDPNFFAPGGAFQQKVETMMNETKSIPGVVGVANFYHDVTGDHGGLGGVDWEPGDKDVNMSFNNLEVGYDFLSILGIEMAQGRNYSREYSGEESKIIFNETAIKKMGLKDPIGQTIKLWGQDRQIIGVVKDFHYESLYQELKPVLVQLVPQTPRIMVKLEGDKMNESISLLRQLYEKHFPGFPFEYKFLEDDYNALYASEQRVSTLAQVFAVLAVLISCLGLYGLTAFTAERRMKEISVRKVFGASEISIMRLLSSEFTTLVLAAMVVGTPLILFAGRSWLSGFAYKTEVSWWYFVAGAVTIFLITVITVSMNTVRASRVNPAETLRSE
jgi:putative ABC transport system permease protein